jgi:hypothetical protein
VGDTFVIQQGERRFNRALYGGNSGFRVETGDLPEFALYLPRMGGTMRLGLRAAQGDTWLIEADQITARYHPGHMSYVIQDSLLGAGKLVLEVLALHQAEGMVLRMKAIDTDPAVRICWMYGAASDARFHREGDIGADPESVFYLTPDKCVGNTYTVQDGSFRLTYETQDRRHPAPKQLRGLFPPGSPVHVVDAAEQRSPGTLLASGATETPALAGTLSAQSEWQYLMVYRPEEEGLDVAYSQAAAMFQRADWDRLKLAHRVMLRTPDSLINPLGAVLGIAADAIWENPAYLHGAIAWRQPLPGWRGAYVADQLGWHDRGRTHLRAYAASQLTEPPSGPVTPDTSRQGARQREEIGTAIFTEGYISRYPDGKNLRAHHYDMNQVYIDELLRHIDWTGDLDFVREMWPVLERHLAWEKRNFDTDGDALYDAYCSFWASDAVQYSGGGVVHASAYHAFANRRVAALAELIGHDPTPYQQEAERIQSALDRELWLPAQGCYAEFKDLLGRQQLHPSPGLWSIYHPIDAQVPDPFQAYQMLQYVDHQIPHLPVRAHGLPKDAYYTLSTTNWLPYTWSVNNVALAEIAHTALAYWQGGRPEAAFTLWKSALIESMYLGASPGSIQQLSFYDAVRGELYRDFADPIGMTARSLVEGLFGIYPHALEGKLSIRPGFPEDWSFATLETPDLAYDFEREDHTDRYRFQLAFSQPMGLSLRLKVPYERIESVHVNGEAVSWQPVAEAIGQPEILIEAAVANRYEVTVVWAGAAIEAPAFPPFVAVGDSFVVETRQAQLLALRDEQGCLAAPQLTDRRLSARVQADTGWRTVFLQLQQGDVTWYAPITVALRAPVEILAPKQQPRDSLVFRVRNNTDAPLLGALWLGEEKQQALSLGAYETSPSFALTSSGLRAGSNQVRVVWGEGKRAVRTLINWNLSYAPGADFTLVDLTPYFNAKVDQIFKQTYASPRPNAPTVQLPLTGIGNWCYPTVAVEIDDAGLRRLAGADGQFSLPQGIPFQTPGPDGPAENVLFTSQWDNYPTELRIPLSGQAKHVYLLMAGSTNPMQSRLDNGRVTVRYADGSADTLALRNPDTWWPIEQDYYLDGYAFYTDTPVPPRVHLKTGLITRKAEEYVAIKGFSETGIAGGAATVLDLPLDSTKELASLTLTALANDVVIGLMGVSLGK